MHCCFKALLRKRINAAWIVALLLLPQVNGKAEASGTGTDVHWKAHWIGALADRGSGSSSVSQVETSSGASLPLPLFRDEFPVPGRVAKATLHISGLGHFEAHINGRNVTDAVLTPGWTDYRKRIFYDTYDVTTLLRSGQNAIGVILGNGMYNVLEAKGRYTKFAGSFGPPKLIVQLDLSFADGTRRSILSDGTWKTSPGPIVFTSVYGGEDYDARLEQPGWDNPGFDDATWSAVGIVEEPTGKLVPEEIPPVKEFERYKPVAVTHPAPETMVYDLGRNFAGWPEIEVSGPQGSAVELIAGELLDSSGFVSQRSANAFPDSRNSFRYILKGQGIERWHPRFSYYGFRYVQVEQHGRPAAAIHKLEGRFLHDAVQVDGNFVASDPLLNRIHTLIDRAILSNLVSVLTDCPHREKLGWLEQTHLAGPSLMYNYDLQAIYAKIAGDMQDAQLTSGMVPDIAPEFSVFEGAFRDSPEWGVADILSTWAAYRFYGDASVLRERYRSMAAYLGYLRGRAQGHLLTYGLGDWYDLGPGPPGVSQLTRKGITATAVYFEALTAMERIAVLTAHSEDTAKYRTEAAAVRDAFTAAYFHPESNQYDNGSQTANAMPLVLGLVPEDRRDAVLANLVADIHAHGDHVTAGDIGFHYVVRALTDNGRSDVLYQMLSRTDKPSYGYQLSQGATTLTEAWDANPASSQNHFMLGHAEEWFYRGLAGIDFDLDREKAARIRIHPAIVGDLQSATATFKSKLGEIGSGWSRTGNTVRMTVSVPEGATATIVFPAHYDRRITLGGRPLQQGRKVSRVQTVNGVTSCITSGGTFVFEASKQ